MTPDQRAELIADFLTNQCLPLLATKGKDYAQDDDVLANFKIVGKLMGITPRECLGVYFSKGMEAIYKSMRGGNPESEPIESRIADAVNYLLIYYCLLKEEREEQEAAKNKPTTRDIHGNSPLSPQYTAAVAGHMTDQSHVLEGRMEWTKNVRHDRGITEWICVHGVGHPDLNTLPPGDKGIHGCCGCCSRSDFPGKLQRKAQPAVFT